MSTAKDKDAAPAADPSAMLGRLDAFTRATEANNTLLARLAEVIEANTAALGQVEEKFGQLVVGSKGGHESRPLSVDQIKTIIAHRPQASFRVIDEHKYAGRVWERGAIIRPQVTEPHIWRGLLDGRIKLEDADEHP